MKKENIKPIEKIIASKYCCNDCLSRQYVLLNAEINKIILFLNVIKEIFDELDNEEMLP